MHDNATRTDHPQPGRQSPYIGKDRRQRVRPEESTLHMLISRLDDMRDDHRETSREVKGSLEKLADAVTVLALVEQQITLTTTAQNNLCIKVDRIEGRVDALEQEAPANKRVEAWVTGTVWALAGGGLLITAKVIASGNLGLVMSALL